MVADGNEDAAWLDDMGTWMNAGMQPRLQVCNPAYVVPVPSQDKLGGLRQEGHPV